MQISSSIYRKIFKALTRLFLQPIFLLVLLVVVSGSGVYLFVQNKSISTEVARLKGEPNEVSQEEIDELLDKVGKLTKLPEDEQPTLATVTDKDAVGDQAFFRDAENGDRVLIFTEAERAILYRPSIDKIIEIAPISIGSNQARKALNVEGDGSAGGISDDVAKRTVNLAIFNSTSLTELTDRVYNELVRSLSELDIVSDNRQDTGGNYENSVVVVLNGDFAQEGQDIANTIGAVTGNLPEGLTAPGTDLLLVIGEDYANQ